MCQPVPRSGIKRVSLGDDLEILSKTITRNPGDSVLVLREGDADLAADFIDYFHGSYGVVVRIDGALRFAFL